MSGAALRGGRGGAEGEGGLGWDAEGGGAGARADGRTGGEAERDTERQEWSMHEVTTSTGTTSRTLRHYDHIGLLPPARVGANGYRYYDAAGLLRLQRILLLRDLGLSLQHIGQVLAGRQEETAALRTHLELLHLEEAQLQRRIAAVQTTLPRRDNEQPRMARQRFDGFDHTQYEQEVTHRWGRQAWTTGDAWWRSLSEEEKRTFQAEQHQIQADYAAAREAGLDPGSDRVRRISARHHTWLRAPMGRVSREYFLGLGQMYVDDERFAANYGGPGGAAYVRDARTAYAEIAEFDT